MALPLEILADLQVAVDGENINVRGDGDRVVVDLPTLQAGRRLFTTGPFATGDRARTTGRVNDALRIAGLTVDVCVRGDLVARLGARAQPSAVARLLNLGDVEVRPTTALVSTVRQRPLATLAAVVGLAALVGWLIARLSRD